MDILEELFFSTKRQLVDNELKRVVNNYISDTQLRDNILYHLCLDSNSTSPTLEHSKRLRAYLCLLFAEESGHNISDIVPLAVTVELLHNSTLLIDDIQDNDILRCGKTALWIKVGIADSINAAYFLGLFSQSYLNLQRLEYGYFDYSTLFAQSISRLISGQQKDINSLSNENKSIESYYEISIGKTGALLNMACCFGSFPMEFNKIKSELIKEFADLFSVAYQIFDDLSDLNNYLISDKNKIDKSNIYYYVSKLNILTKQGIKETLPLIKSIQDELITKLLNSINKMKNNNLIKTEKLNNFIKTIIKSQLL
jgi:geranylgeranyl pyrophosphate synthase